MGRPGYATQVGAQPQCNVRNRHEVHKISLTLGSAKCLGLMDTHALPQSCCGHVNSLSSLTMALTGPRAAHLLALTTAGDLAYQQWL